MVIGSIGIATTSCFGRIVGLRWRRAATLEHRVELGPHGLGGGCGGGFSDHRGAIVRRKPGGRETREDVVLTPLPKPPALLFSLPRRPTWLRPPCLRLRLRWLLSRHPFLFGSPEQVRA